MCRAHVTRAKLSPIPGLGLIACLSLVAAGAEAQPAYSSQVEYFVAEVRVTKGGNPVLGVKGGTLFAQNSVYGCQSAPTGDVTLALPFSASLATPVAIDIVVAPCADDTASPSVQCTWNVTPAEHQDLSCQQFDVSQRLMSQQVKSWVEWDNRLTISPPSLTGIYEFHLTCELSGEAALNIKSPLFVTYSKPLDFVSPARVDWYTRATCWAGGLGVDASEGDVLDKMVSGLYKYGRENWRYGYANPGDVKGVYEFPLASSEGNSRKITYDFSDPFTRPGCNGSICKCHWQSMVAKGSLCDFGDCYVFSDILSGISGTMGIGGLRYYTIQGTSQLGFTTVPGTESLDSKFTRSVSCEKGTDCPPYYFGNHSLRLRDGVYYDATFGNQYPTEGSGIAWNRDNFNSTLLTFVESGSALRYLGSGYGSWSFYRETTSNEDQAPDPSGEIEFDDHVELRPYDADEDGRYENLIAELEVWVQTAGPYLVHGVLTREAAGEDGGRTEQIIAIRPNYWTPQPTVATIDGTAGKHRVRLRFSGQEIYQSGYNGKIKVLAVATKADITGDARGMVATLSEVVDHKFFFKDFGEISAGIQDSIIMGRDHNGDGKFDTLQVKVLLSVWKSGLFALEGRLYHGLAGPNELPLPDRKTISYSGSKGFFQKGKFWIDLEFPGSEIAMSRLEGPLKLTIILYGDQLTTEIVSQEWPVEGFLPSQFE